MAVVHASCTHCRNELAFSNHRYFENSSAPRPFHSSMTLLVWAMNVVYLIWQAGASDRLLTIRVTIKEPPKYTPWFNKCNFEIKLYPKKECTGAQLRAKVEKELQAKFQPECLAVDYVLPSSDVDFEGRFSRLSNASAERPINLRIAVHRVYSHQPDCVPSITCPHMLRRKSRDAADCPIYTWMTRYNETSRTLLQHIRDYTHFIDEFNRKPVCKHKDRCGAFVRVERGGNSLSDLFHLQLYRHPPRSRRINLTENIQPMLFKEAREFHAVATRLSQRDKAPTHEDLELNFIDCHSPVSKGAGPRYQRWYDHRLRDCPSLQDQLEVFECKQLMAEVERNGFGRNLTMSDNSSLLLVAHDLMRHQRHLDMGSPLNRAEMLSLVMYTGCDCNYDLCASQRAGDYTKWKWFDSYLFEAICKLSERERGAFTVYTSLNKCMLNRSEVECGWFPTYISTSWDEQASLDFIEETGMLIEIDRAFKDLPNVHCCDVSWISKFPDEAEILFARSVHSRDVRGVYFGDQSFSCVVSDSSGKIQKVKLVAGSTKKSP